MAPAGRSKIWRCQVCGFTYRAEDGLPDEHISPGTRWEDIPDDWVCPDCGTRKADFHMVEADEVSLSY